MKLIDLGNGRAAIVDDEDFESLNAHKWTCAKWNGGAYYAVRWLSRHERPDDRPREALMHRVVMGVTDPKVHVDHIDHNTLDNRRSQLRVVTPRQNHQNRKARKEGRSSSRFPGATWHASAKKWQAQIQIGTRTAYLGLYATEEEAGAAYGLCAAGLMPNPHARKTP